MGSTARSIYIISDLHLGGVYPDPAKPGDRGFRICTHAADVAAFIQTLTGKPAGTVELVINGDLVDFLAERDAGSGGWSPFTADPATARDKFLAIAGRDKGFFDALRGFVHAGHRLVLLLGNHDIELALPPVRRALREALGATGACDVEFIADGEAYVTGDALIEHGNRYDQWNVVDYDALRRCASLISRRQQIPADYTFHPPAGSRMVVEVVNPIKQDYRFIDLLKPETGAMIPLLLALEPGYRPALARSAELAFTTRRHRLESASLPSFGGDISASGGPATDFGQDISSASSGGGGDQGLHDALRQVMGSGADAFLHDIAGSSSGTDQIGSDISTMETIDRAFGFIRMVLGKAHSDYEGRLPLLLKSLRALQNDKTFDPGIETAPEYLNAAKDLAKGGIRHVVFGHTHLAKRIPLDGGGFYLNSGTWADVLQLPSNILTGDDAAALANLDVFVKAVAANDFSAWTLFRPTYVRLDCREDGTVAAAELCPYEAAAKA